MGILTSGPWGVGNRAVSPTMEPPEHPVQTRAPSLPDPGPCCPPRARPVAGGTESETLSGQEDLLGLWGPQTLSAQFPSPAQDVDP